MFSSSFANNYESADIDRIFNKENFHINISEDELDIMKNVFIKSHAYSITTNAEYIKFMNKEIHNRIPKIKLIKGYRILLQNKQIEHNLNLERFMKLKGVRGNSGIIQITVFTSPYQFGMKDDIKRGGCPHDCYYCPFEKDINGTPTQPRSYLSTEPGNMRATQNKHHPVGQIFDRLNTLEKMGHISSIADSSAKIEFMISGGTFNFYPIDYIIWFCTMCYYAMNVYYDYTLNGQVREPFTLEEEQHINETSFIRMIGLTIESRPDYLLSKDDPLQYIRLFRRIGVTRVQIGTQHIDNFILKYVNRGCTNEQNQEGNKILMQNGFKVDNHWMLDLPSSSPKQDMDMIDYISKNDNYHVDQLKIYPTMVTEHTRIYDWYRDGTYKPYAEEDFGSKLIDVIIHFKCNIPYFTRINRIIRDIPPESIYGGVNCPDMRQHIVKKMVQNNAYCKCIRCREIKDGEFNENDCYLYCDKYNACDGINYFISYENKSRTKLYGFLRLRFNQSTKYMLQELQDYAIIRELHVYGNHTGVGDNTNQTQHRGLGKNLIAKAEEIASLNGYTKIMVISGVGVRGYYRKLGYTDFHTYMVKDIVSDMIKDNILPLIYQKKIYIKSYLMIVFYIKSYLMIVFALYCYTIFM